MSASSISYIKSHRTSILNAVSNTYQEANSKFLHSAEYSKMESCLYDHWLMSILKENAKHIFRRRNIPIKIKKTTRYPWRDSFQWCCFSYYFYSYWSIWSKDCWYVVNWITNTLFRRNRIIFSLPTRQNICMSLLLKKVSLDKIHVIYSDWIVTFLLLLDFYIHIFNLKKKKI